MQTETSAAPLVVLRTGFGLMMLMSLVRFWANGWIDKLYLQPEFFFSYRYFEWVKPLGMWTYALFAVTGCAAACITVGYRYRVAMILFFLGFTYIELMDKTTYLNHYYFVSLLSFLLIWVPIPAGFRAGLRRDGGGVSPWYARSIMLFVGVVYCYAGLAKLNSDWLFHAQPLSIWLPANYSIPVLGDLLQQRWVHFAFAWGGAAYDLAIPFLLLARRTRVFGFFLVVLFHVLTRVLFPIGMFPFIMMVSATIFFGASAHERVLAPLAQLETWLRGRLTAYRPVKNYPGLSCAMIGTVLVFHLVFPLRHVSRPGELFWTENGYRFSWRVMLMEKAGMASFRVEDAGTDRRVVIDNRRFLTVFQEKQLATQPDFILEYAHFLAAHYRELGFQRPRVFVDSYVALNGRLSQRYVDPNTDLATVSPHSPPGSWLLPFNHTIYGF